MAAPKKAAAKAAPKDADLDGIKVETDDRPEPVYDQRGNVRPHGTPGAKPMSYEERKAIAERIQSGAEIATTAEQAD